MDLNDQTTPPSMPRSFDRSLPLPYQVGLILLVWAVYIIIFPIIYAQLGPAGLSLSGVPVIITAWFLGPWWGAASAVIVTLLNYLLMRWVSPDNWSDIFLNSLIGMVVLICGGVILGRLRDLGLRLNKELIEKERTTQKYQSIVESSTDGIALVNEQGLVIEWNQGAERLTGLSQNSVLGRAIWDVCYDIEPEERKSAAFLDKLRGQVFEVLESGDGYWLYQFEEREIQHLDDSRFFIQLNKYPIKTSTGHMIGIFARDISERKKTEQMLIEREERFRATISQSADGILVADENFQIIEWSSQQTAIFGYNREEMIDRYVWEFQFSILPEEKRPPGLLENLKERALLIRDDPELFTKDYPLDLEIQAKNGTRKTIQISTFPIQTSDQSFYGVISRDVSVQKRFEEQLQYAATHDVLTDLPNRTLFNDRLVHSLAKAERSQAKLGLLYIDLDNFKTINDTLGHNAGDMLLKGFAARLQTQSRRSDTLARISGDEFLMILETLADYDDAGSVAKKLLELGNEPYSINGKKVISTLSIGISLYPKDGQNPITLIDKADTAMYQAKQSGKNQYQFYSE